MIRLNDLWKYDIQRNTWSQMVVESSACPCRRSNHTMVWHNNCIWYRIYYYSSVVALLSL